MRSILNHKINDGLVYQKVDETEIYIGLYSHAQWVTAACLARQHMHNAS